MSTAPRSREEVERRRLLRRRQVRRRRIAALVVLLLVVGAGVGAALAVTGGSDAPSAAGTGSEPEATSAANPATPAGTTAVAHARPDGSLGARNVRLACTLLRKSEIKAQFDQPVGKPVPVWPYCQWLVGKDAWVAAWVSTKTSFDKVRDRSYVLEDVPGLGDDAFFGTDRYLYFGANGVSYWVLYQKTDEFTEIHKEELIALAQTMLSRPLDTEPAATPPGEPAQVEIAKPTPADPLTVYFGGDSLSAGPEWMFREKTSTDKATHATSEYQVGTGLIRNDYFDWKRHLEGVVRAREPEVVVFMTGANDSQDFIVGGTYYPYTTERWHRLYEKRVSAIMDVLTANGRKVVWVGMPPMRDKTLNSGMAEVNGVFATEAEKRPGSVEYVDTWQLFSAPGGGYTDTLPDEDGNQEQVRLEDGIHLNVPGSERLAVAIMAAVEKITSASQA
jgi:hypothetical protein